MSERDSIFQRPAWVVCFALTAAIGWGWAFPLIKIGFSAFGIMTYMTGSKMLFAGIRFAVAGLIVLLVARSSRRSFSFKRRSELGRGITGNMGDWCFVLAFALMNTALHYFFFYIGMSYSEGSRAAILNSLSTFLVVLLACACFKSDKLTSRKILGCIVEFLLDKVVDKLHRLTSRCQSFRLIVVRQIHRNGGIVGMTGVGQCIALHQLEIVEGT